MKSTGKKPALELGVYRHYKGGIYEVLGIACNSETLEWYVVYQSQERKEQGLPSVWIRPYGMFIEKVKVGDKMKQRFERIQD